MVGLLFSTPLLVRLYRRDHSWQAPAIALAVVVAMFSSFTFVVGPILSDSYRFASSGHEQHHPAP